MIGTMSPFDGRILISFSSSRRLKYSAFSCNVVTSSGCCSSSRSAVKAAAQFAGGMDAEKMKGRELCRT